tara:strand:+ start:14396 stop:14857 length:462 start_codon:yes stop_codon:yes gene_type:complete
MSLPQKIDGFGTRYIGAARTVNTSNREKFVRLYASEALVKGDVVCVDWATSTYGYGAHCKKAVAGTPLIAQAVGIVSETIAINDIGLIQVQGICDYAKLDISESVPGDVLGPEGSAVAGKADAAGILPFAINISEGTDVTADSTVYLLNSHNY